MTRNSMCLRKISIFVQVWAINSKYDGIYFCITFLENGSARKWHLHIPEQI